MNVILRSEEFIHWLKSLRDLRGKLAIDRRIHRMRVGNLGDHKGLGDGLSELRVDVGPGYRIYFTRRAEVVFLLLIGGDKSTQAQDIATARRMIETLALE